MNGPHALSRRESLSARALSLGARLVAIGFVVSATCGCMLMRNGRTQLVPVDSSPAGATVKIQPSGETFTTPSQVALARKQTYVLHVEKDGYEPATVALQSKSSGSLWWRNLVWIHPLGWLAGVITDVSTGAGSHLEPETVAVTLAPVSSEQLSDAPGSGGR